MSELTDMIKTSLKKIRSERKEQIVRIRLEQESAYNIQYMPCGHSRGIRNSEFELLRRAMTRMKLGYFDALTLSSVDCPFCDPSLED